MGYWITKFKGVSLPQRAPSQEVGAGQAHSGLVRLPNGRAYDALGAGRAYVTPHTVSVRGAVTAATPAALHTAVEELAGLVGEAGTLYRTPDGGTANSQWVWARCLDVGIDRDVRQRLFAHVSLTFEVQSYTWQGTALQTTAGTFTSSPGTVTVNNAGNEVQRDAIIEVVASGGALTYLRVRNYLTGHMAALNWGTAYGSGSGGTVASGGTLTIDTGDWSVLLDGSNAFNKFAVNVSHEIDEWMRLAPGNNSVRVDYSGGGNCILRVKHYDAYA